MKRLSVVLLLASSIAFADVPIAKLDEPLPARVKAGEAAPYDGILMPSALALYTAKEIERCLASEVELKKTSTAPTTYIIIGAIAFVVAFFGGLGVGYAIKK